MSSVVKYYLRNKKIPDSHGKIAAFLLFLFFIVVILINVFA